MYMENMTVVIIPQEEWANIKNQQLQILEQLKDLQKPKQVGIPVSYITAQSFFGEFWFILLKEKNNVCME
jgi:hypothetical protein